MKWIKSTGNHYYWIMQNRSYYSNGGGGRNRTAVQNQLNFKSFTSLFSLLSQTKKDSQASNQRFLTGCAPLAEVTGFSPVVDQVFPLRFLFLDPGRILSQ